MNSVERCDVLNAPDVVAFEHGLACHGVSLCLGEQQVLQEVDVVLPNRGVTCLIGPSGAGKSSLLRCITGLHETWTGDIHIEGQSVRHWQGGVDALRRQVGLIAQKPTVFPTTIEQNVLFGLSRKEKKSLGREGVQHCLQQAALWDEVAHRLDDAATDLSLGQQQRLCLARALALKPSMLLLDEPTASLDPRSKASIEQSIRALAVVMPVLCVTHDLVQAQRLSQYIMFMCAGRLLESGFSDALFQHPKRLETREFLCWSVCDCSASEEK